ncbi:hypothetical protein TrCOL_g12465 [Triparma columacea]|uniref:Uncharacterized protein n=1 Tax=Triparma columacea TaxID=722753 RepID=A0A9W7FX16_9STRA|nr:hypothetical protein TrCOL_g12465 [Triparma columacea]
MISLHLRHTSKSRDPSLPPGCSQSSNNPKLKGWGGNGNPLSKVGNVWDSDIRQTNPLHPPVISGHSITVGGGMFVNLGFGKEGEDEERIYVDEGGTCWRLRGRGVWKCVDRMVNEILTCSSTLPSATSSSSHRVLQLGQGTPPSSSSHSNADPKRGEAEVSRAFKKALMDCITRDAFRDVGRKVEELVRDDEDVRGMLRDMWGW